MTDLAQLFQKGVDAFNSRNYYDAHEHWEELWSDHVIPDRIFIQGMIQYAVACFHITNQNLKGARSLFRKALGKFEQVSETNRISNYPELVSTVKAALMEAESCENHASFNWDLIGEIKV